MLRLKWCKGVLQEIFDAPRRLRTPQKTLTLCELKQNFDPRRNEVGIQMIPHDLRKQLFHNNFPICKDTRPGLLAARNLLRVGLSKNTLPTQVDPSIRLPSIIGNSIAEHVYAISSYQVRPYLNAIKEIYNLGKPCEPPSYNHWQIRPGWVEYKYNNERGSYDTRGVEYPDGDFMTLDTEVFFNRSKYPAVATAISTVGWYLWLSPIVVVNYHKKKPYEKKELQEYATVKLLTSDAGIFKLFEQDNKERGINFNFSDEDLAFSPQDIESEEGRVYNIDPIEQLCEDDDIMLPSSLKIEKYIDDNYNDNYITVYKPDNIKDYSQELDFNNNKGFSPKTLIPLGSQNREKVIVGHNVNYDRNKILEDRNFQSTKYVYLDTMSMHNCLAGLSMQLFSKWMYDRKLTRVKGAHAKHADKPANPEAYSLNSNFIKRMLIEQGFFSRSAKHLENEMKENSIGDLKKFGVRLWSDISSPSGLDDISLFYLNEKVNKDSRSITSMVNMYLACSDEVLRELISYCAKDTDLTYHIFKILFVLFRYKCPHPASLSAMMILSKPFLSTSRRWNSYINKSEKTYKYNTNAINAHLSGIIKFVLKYAKKKPEIIANDPYLKYLNWSPSKPDTLYSDIFPFNMIFENKNARIPKWCKEAMDPKTGKIDVSMSSIIVPYMLRLKFDGYLIYYSRYFGWTYKVPINDEDGYKKALKHGRPVRFGKSKNDRRYEKFASNDDSHYYFRIPCPETRDKFCNNPFSKSYTDHFENERFTSDFYSLNTIVNLYHQCTLWTSMKTRLSSELVVSGNEDPWIGFGYGNKRTSNASVILPRTIPAGTLTRRIVDQTWLIAPNPEDSMIGSEIKLCVHTPEDYCVIGCDVDSEELWVATLMGDAQYGVHGSTPVGFMMLQGDKKRGTDMHSVTSKTLLVDRDEAKIYNYARFYGAGPDFVSNMMEMLHGDKISFDDITRRTNKLMIKTKGVKFYTSNDRLVTTKNKKKSYENVTECLEDEIVGMNMESSEINDKYWAGGLESHLFNTIEGIVERNSIPRTPALGCGMPSSLLPRYVGTNHRRTRHNWIVQSSGVDYLHLLLVTMKYLMERMKIDGRYMVSVHDEIRFLIAKKDLFMGLLAFQVANIWTRATFAQCLGIRDLAIATTYFSSIDVDHCLRKNNEKNNLTPSNDIEELDGKQYDIHNLMLHFNNSKYKIRMSDNDDDPNLINIYPEELKGVKEEEKIFNYYKFVYGSNELSDDYDIHDPDIAIRNEASKDNAFMNLAYSQGLEIGFISSSRYQKATTTLLENPRYKKFIKPTKPKFASK